MSKERWKLVVGTNGYYEVSSQGRVRRAKPGRGLHGDGTWVGRVLKPEVCNGYYRVCLVFGNGRYRKFVHVLMMQAFVGPCPVGFEVNHKNGIKTKNRLWNLEYLTKSENAKHALRLGLKKPLRADKCPTAKLSWKEVRAIRREYRRKTWGRGPVALSKKYGVGCQTVLNIVNGVTWK